MPAEQSDSGCGHEHRADADRSHHRDRAQFKQDGIVSSDRWDIASLNHIERRCRVLGVG
jgi:hypothetical protein